MGAMKKAIRYRHSSNPPYFFWISSKVLFMLLKQELRRKAENIKNLVSCQNN